MSFVRDLARRCRVLPGVHASVIFNLQKALADFPREELMWVGGESVAGINTVKASEVPSVLGSEVSLLVFDAHAGFHPDAFAAALGTLRGGGELILLVPDWQGWSEYADPDKQRLAPYPLSIDAVGNRFIARMQLMFSRAECVQVEDVTSVRISFPSAEIPGKMILNKDQERAVDVILRVANGHAKRPLVITADRGRGKSTALGQGIAALMQQGKQLVLLAPKRLAVQAVYAQLKRALPDVTQKDGVLRWQGGSLHFFLPDDFLQQKVSADVLLVDEAAVIPLALLERLLGRCNRLVFSTTVHGYEGTGRGFELRFEKMLGQLMPQWKAFRLSKPVRWVEGDPLEKLINASLLLDVDLCRKKQGAAAIEYRWLKQEALAVDEPLLHQVFSLLVAAHYQTRPSDLRQLLDAPCLTIRIAMQQETVVAVLVAVAEGGFDGALADDVWAGRRRPRGHMLLQSLSCHAGYLEAPTRRLLRVMRIAVHPDFRRQGIASSMLEQLKQFAREASFDLLGVSYALDSEVFGLWQKAGFQTVRAGYRRDAASGQHSVQMLSPLSMAGKALAEIATQRFQQQLPWQLATGLSDLEARLAALLMSGRPCSDMPLSGQDRLDLEALATGHRQWVEVVPLWHWLCRVLAGHEKVSLSTLECNILIPLVLQRREQKWVVDAFNLDGAKALEKIVRQAVAKYS